MNQGEKKTGSLTDIEWYKIFDKLQTGDLKDVKAALPGRNRTTIIRAYSVARELIKIGNASLDKGKIKQIVDSAGYSTTEKFVTHAGFYYGRWLDRKSNSEETIVHLRYLNALFSRIKNTIVNPHTETRFYPSHTTAWMFGGQDWRLTPKAWEMLVLPLLDDETIWNKPILFRYLLEHIINSPFKQHYDELKEEISKFQEEFYDVAENIKVNNPQMVADWDALDADLRNYVVVHKPMNSLMSLDRDDLENYIIGQKDMSIDLEADRVHISEIDPQYYEDLLIAFREYIVDLGNRYIVLEDLLQQLCDDLDEIEFKDIIKKGSCEKCRTSIKAEQISANDGTSGLIDALQQKTKGNPSVDVRLDM
jgi:hypothetical protein